MSYLVKDPKDRFSRDEAHMCHVMREPVYGICAQNKDADQPVHLRSLINGFVKFVIHSLARIISLVAIPKIISVVAVPKISRL